MILTAKHPELDNEKSYLATPTVAGATTTPLKSAVGVIIDDYVILGYPGREKTEIVLITGKSGNSIQHAATAFGHSVDSPVTVIKYNKVLFYESATLTGSYAVITDVAGVDIDIDDSETRFEYDAGSPTKYYKASYYNTELGIESALSDPLIGTGYSRRALASIIKEVRTYVGDRPSDDEITMAVNSAQDIICGIDDRWYFAKKSAVLTFDDDSNSAAVPVDFLTLDRIEMSVTASTTTTTTKLKYYTEDNFMTKFPSVNTATKANPASYTIKEGEDKIYLDSIVVDAATPATVSFKIFYWAKPTALVEYTDETIIPSPASIVFWCASKLEAAKKNTDTSGIYWQEYSSQIKAMTNRRKGGEKNFSIGK